MTIPRESSLGLDRRRFEVLVLLCTAREPQLRAAARPLAISSWEAQVACVPLEI